MQVIKGKEGLTHTQQDAFNETISCDCGCEARLAFVAEETYPADGHDKAIRDMYHNEMSRGGAFWPHDLVSVAVYFCTKCGKAVVDWNQA